MIIDHVKVDAIQKGTEMFNGQQHSQEFRFSDDVVLFVFRQSLYEVRNRILVFFHQDGLNSSYS